MKVRRGQLKFFSSANLEKKSNGNIYSYGLNSLLLYSRHIKVTNWIISVKYINSPSDFSHDSTTLSSPRIYLPKCPNLMMQNTKIEIFVQMLLVIYDQQQFWPVLLHLFLPAVLVLQLWPVQVLSGFDINPPSVVSKPPCPSDSLGLCFAPVLSSFCCSDGGWIRDLGFISEQIGTAALPLHLQQHSRAEGLGSGVRLRARGRDAACMTRLLSGGVADVRWRGHCVLLIWAIGSLCWRLIRLKSLTSV